MFIKKFMSMLLLTATISMTVAVPGHAAMKITDANSYKWSKTGSEWKVVDGSGNPASGFISYNDLTSAFAVSVEVSTFTPVSIAFLLIINPSLLPAIPLIGTSITISIS